jgi:hypothetical protein
MLADRQQMIFKFTDGNDCGLTPFLFDLLKFPVRFSRSAVM